MPSHTHSGNVSLSGITCSSAGAHSHNVYAYEYNDRRYRHGLYKGAFERGGSVGGIIAEYPLQSSDVIAETAGAHTHEISGSGTATIGSTGGSQAHNNLPPYYALCYIMKI